MNYKHIKSLGYKRNTKAFHNWQGAIIAKALRRYLTERPTRYFTHQGHKYRVFFVRTDLTTCSRYHLIILTGRSKKFEMKGRLVAHVKIPFSPFHSWKPDVVRGFYPIRK